MTFCPSSNNVEVPRKALPYLLFNQVSRISLNDVLVVIIARVTAIKIRDVYPSVTCTVAIDQIVRGIANVKPLS